MTQKKVLIAGAVLLIAVAIVTGISFSGDKKDGAMNAMAPAAGPMPVDMAVIMPQSIQIWKNFSGHVVAVDHADIRPQVSGRITDIRFENGQSVKKGDILVVIDPRPYEATLNQAKAALNVAKTEAALAEKEYDRAKKLIGTEAISQSLLDERTNKHQSALAAVKGAQALVQSAQINLDYAYVKAPISGKVSRAEITEGNLVQAGASAPLLTSIVADDKVYVDFEVDEKTYLDAAKAGAMVQEDAKIPVKLKLANEEYNVQGVVQSFDNRIDPASGTIRARAVFDNDQKLLLPGMSVSVMMGAADESGKILVTERAIGTDQDRKFVFVVGDDNTAQYREVKIGESINGERVVLSGLEAGETVITEGLVRVRPGAEVTQKQDEAEKTEEAGIAPAAAADDSEPDNDAPENDMSAKE